ncbi:enoyl-CoA hydratase-related protein [Gammaproteobacteria bacterium]|nr:enoyl-CoA hydratase-related protein [Gammaproteobacteria bacterium]
MSDYENLLIDRVGTDGRVGRITLNRPEKRNALSRQLFTELNDALHDMEADHSVRVVVLRGAGPVFCAGHDLAGSPGGRSYKFRDDSGRKLLMNMRTSIQQNTDVMMYFWNMAKVTISCLHGFASSGGCELAMMADLVVAADDTQIGHPGHRGVGVARNGMIWPLVIGMRKAKELSYTGDYITGLEAEQIGMINYAWPESELEERTIAFADRIAIASADHLGVLKVNMNRFYENMGIQSSVRSSVEQDAMAQFTEFAYEWQDRISQNGLKAALAWRDDPYKELDTYKK